LDAYTIPNRRFGAPAEWWPAARRDADSGIICTRVGEWGNVTKSHIETVREYWAASDRADWETAGQCVGNGFTWVDHTFSDAPMEGALALAEAQAWSDQTLAIDQWHEATDGTLIVLATVTQTLTGTWRGVEPRGQRVTNKICDIFRFDEDGLIVHEELFADALAVMRQLGALS
jgi:ketosteroid isomerase-like protein